MTDLRDGKRSDALRAAAADRIAGAPPGTSADSELVDWSRPSESERFALEEMQAAWDAMPALAARPAYARLLGELTWRERLMATGRNAFGPVGSRLLATAGMACCIVALAITHPWAHPAFEKLVVANVGPLLVTLADRSTVRLNKGSALWLDVGSGGERAMRLERGSATFTVTHDVAHPLFVAAGSVVVHDVGTRFEIQHIAGCTQLSVDEGIVEVTVGALRRRMVAGEQLASVSRVASPASCSAKLPAVRFSYQDAPLGTVIEEANRFYGDRLRIASPTLGKLRVTTAFEVSQIAPMVNSLPRILPISVEHVGNYILLRNRTHSEPAVGGK